MEPKIFNFSRLFQFSSQFHLNLPSGFNLKAENYSLSTYEGSLMKTQGNPITNLFLQKLNFKDSLDMSPRRHRELLWRHKGDWKRPESNSNGLYSTAPENTSPNSNFPGNVWKINLKISEYNRITF